MDDVSDGSDRDGSDRGSGDPTVGAAATAPATAPASPPVDLSGETALVTGATSGLGRHFAWVLARLGARVVVTGRRVERLEALAAEARQDGLTMVPHALDMTDAAAIERVLDTVWHDLGGVSILVNNAGVPDAQRAHKMSVELIDRVIDTNLRGPYVASCELARRLIADGRPGRIVNISSMAAFHYDGMGAALYSTTKAAVVRMTEALAVEWARHRINVNAIAPGAFRSEMMDGMLERVGDITEAFPRRRLGEPDQLDSTLVYLCSPASEAVTGTVIKVDDGQGSR